MKPQSIQSNSISQNCPWRFLFIGLILIALLSSLSPAADEENSKAVRRSSPEGVSIPKGQKRVALVIGNNDYKDAPLRNPTHDAEDIANVLRGLGFTVQIKINANQREMEESVGEFVREIQNGDVGLFYFSGHGVQVGGDNYLIPVGGSIETETDVRYKAVNAGLILGKMEESRNRTNIFILDACRNNPFKGFRSLSKGLTMMDAPVGTFIAYATAPGSVAADGTDRNSPYAKHFMQAVKPKGMKIEDVFKQVLREVEKETEGKQIPWIASSLQDDFYFNPPFPASPSTRSSEIATAETPAAPERERIEIENRDREQEVARLREAQRIAALEKRRLEMERQELLTRMSPEQMLGIETENLTSSNAGQTGLRSDEGVRVKAVDPDRVGGKMGIKSGDVIIEIDGEPIHVIGEFNNGVHNSIKNEVIRFRVARGRSKLYLAAELNLSNLVRLPARPVLPSQGESGNQTSLSQRAKNGDALAQDALGNAYSDGKGVAKDYGEAVKWYRKAAEQGNKWGQNSLGYMYDNGWGVAKDYEEAVKWYRKAAEQGNAAAQTNLGLMYDNGKGVAKDYGEAVKWYRKAAEQGYSDAQTNLGAMYNNGNGVAKDYEEAVKWYRKAAEQGNKWGQNNLGTKYRDGLGVAKDYAEAVKLFMKAAEQGNVYAQYNLGLMYKNGNGVAKDQAGARKWFTKAADQGNEEAKKELRKMGGTSSK